MPTQTNALRQYNRQTSPFLDSKSQEGNNELPNRSTGNADESLPDPKRTSAASALPSEIVFEILMRAQDDQPTLYQAALVCRKWCKCAVPLLYSDVKLEQTFDWATFVLTLTRTKPSFPFGQYVRSLDLSSREIEMGKAKRQFVWHMSLLEDVLT